MLLLSVRTCDAWGVCCAALTEQFTHLLLACEKQRNAFHVSCAVCVSCCTADITQLSQGDHHSQNLALRPLMNVLICATSTLHVPSSS